MMNTRTGETIVEKEDSRVTRKRLYLEILWEEKKSREKLVAEID